MNLQQMRLSDHSLGKLSQLALAVELHEHKRFKLRKDIDQVIGLLKIASNSANNAIQSKLSDFTSSLNADSFGFFRTLGIDLSEPSPAKKSQRTYRGQALETKEPSSAKTETASSDDNSKKKKIIYRGKVIYR